MMEEKVFMTEKDVFKMVDTKQPEVVDTFGVDGHFYLIDKRRSFYERNIYRINKSVKEIIKLINLIGKGLRNNKVIKKKMNHVPYEVMRDEVFPVAEEYSDEYEYMLWEEYFYFAPIEEVEEEPIFSNMLERMRYYKNKKVDTHEETKKDEEEKNRKKYWAIKNSINRKKIKDTEKKVEKRRNKYVLGSKIEEED